MARQRDYKAERERSNELARQRGFRNAQEQRRARKAAEAEGRARAEATAEQYRERIARRRDEARRQAGERRTEARERAAAIRQQVYELPNGNVVVTTTAGLKGWGVIAGRLSAHGSRPVTMRLIMRDGRVVTVWPAGYAARAVRENVTDVESAAKAANGRGSYGAGEVEASEIVSVQFELRDEGV